MYTMLLKRIPKGKHVVFSLGCIAQFFAMFFTFPKSHHMNFKHLKLNIIVQLRHQNCGHLDLGPGVLYNVPMAWNIGRIMLISLAVQPHLKVCVLGNSALNANAHAAAGRRLRGDLAALHPNDYPRLLISTRGCVADISLGTPVSLFLSQKDGDKKHD
jgi:hypothetical protein